MIAKARVPAVTILLIAANLLAAFWIALEPPTSAGYPALIDQLGFRANAPSIGTAFTSLFLHANILHLLGNMVFLAAVGVAVELATGSFRFCVVYFLSGLFGVAVYYVLTRQSPSSVPLVGASGCIAGCAAYYSVRYVGLKVPIAPNLGVSVATVTGLWLALQVVGAFVKLGDSGGTSFWAHLGGFAAGILISLVFRAPDLGQAKLGHEVLERMNLRGPAAVVHAAQEHLKLHPGDPKAMEELARAYGMLGDVKSETQTLFQMLNASPEDRHPEILTRLCEIGSASVLPAARRTLYAEKYKQEYPNLAKGLLQSVVDGPEDVGTPDAMLALAALQREECPEEADALLSELQRRYPLHAAVDLARKRGWVT